MILHIVQPCPRPAVWYHTPGSSSMRVGGLAPLLAIRCLQAAHPNQHAALLIGNNTAREVARSAGVRVARVLCPPLHAVSRAGPSLRAFLRSHDAFTSIICWGGTSSTWEGLVRRCVNSSRDASWHWVCTDTGLMRTLQGTPTENASPLALPSISELARVLPPTDASRDANSAVQVQHDRAFALLGDAGAPGDASKAAWLSTILHTADLHHACLIPEQGSVLIAAARRVLQDKGSVRELLFVQQPLLDWLHRCEAAAIFAPEHVACRWALAALVHAALARGVTPVLSEPDARVLASFGADISCALLAEHDTPAKFARCMLPKLVASKLTVPASITKHSNTSARFADAWQTHLPLEAARA